MKFKVGDCVFVSKAYVNIENMSVGEVIGLSHKMPMGKVEQIRINRKNKVFYTIREYTINGPTCFCYPDMPEECCFEHSDEAGIDLIRKKLLNLQNWMNKLENRKKTIMKEKRDEV